MKTLFFILLYFLAFVSFLYAQYPDKIIITTIEKTDRTYHKKEKLLLRTDVVKNQVVYTYDSVGRSFNSKEFLTETYYNIWDGNKTVKDHLKKRYKKWTNSITYPESQDLLRALKTDIDTLPKDLRTLHTSHHYLTIYLDVVLGNDTVNYYKTKPFGYFTPWLKNISGTALYSESILNPGIDKHLYICFPKNSSGEKN